MILRTRGFARFALALAAGGACVVASAALPDDDGSSPGCALSQVGRIETSTESCMACHRLGSGSNHPVGMDYAAAQASHWDEMGLRPPSEVVKRGVFLADGKVQCRTCHDPRSPWKDHIALPPGAKPMPAVNPRDPSTYEDGPLRDAKIQELRAHTMSRGGARLPVTPKPLCLACHAMD